MGGSPILGPPTRCCRRLRILSQGVKGHSGQGCALRIVQAPPRDPSCEIPMARLLLSCPRYGQGAPGEQGGQSGPPSKSLEHWTQTRLPLPFSGEKRSIPGPPRAPQGVWPRPWPPPTRCCGILFSRAKCPEAGKVTPVGTSDGDVLYLPPKASPAEALGQGGLLPRTPD